MESALILRIENIKILKTYKVFKILLPIIMLPLLLDLFLGISINTIDLIGFCLIVFGNIVSAWMFIDYKAKISKNKGMPFVEWWTDKVVFRNSKTGQKFEIVIDNISDISVKFDEIFISTKNDKTFEINLDEYIEYDQRVKIKDSFLVLSKQIDNNVIARNEAIST